MVGAVVGAGQEEEDMPVVEMACMFIMPQTVVERSSWGA